MTIDIIALIILLTLFYSLLIWIIHKKQYFRNKLILLSTVIVFFMFIQSQLFNNLGYPTSESLPDKFLLLYVHKTKDYFIVLTRDADNMSSTPRLHKLKYSLNLQKTLVDAQESMKQGHRIIGSINNNDENYYGISFSKIKKQVPAK